MRAVEKEEKHQETDPPSDKRPMGSSLPVSQTPE